MFLNVIAAGCVHGIVRQRALILKKHKIDYSRCVVCMNCLGKCKKGAIKYTRRIPEIEAEPEMITTSKAKSVTTEQVDNARRSFLSASAIFATTAALKAQEKKVDGGLATIEDKKIPHRENPILPPGSLSARNLHSIAQPVNYVFRFVLIRYSALLAIC